MRIPKDVEYKVVSKLYADAVAAEWPSLTPQQHSAQYSKWIDDPLVGGRLLEYISAGDARVWIKDGPMKEYSRSSSGVGKYAHLVAGSSEAQAGLVRKALGPGWSLEPDTQRIKPLRVVARNSDGDEEVVVTWGPAKDLKHLVWAALVGAAEGDSRDWVLCVVEGFTNPTPANERQAHLRLATRCNLRIVHVSL